jgi:hypothetical protein
MANPNIVNLTTITGKTSVFIATATLATVVSNPASSNKIFKVNSLYVSNTSSTTAYSVTVDVLRSSTSYKIANTISVPANASLVVIDKNANVYLEEGDTLRASGSTANFLHIVTSYEEIS